MVFIIKLGRAGGIGFFKIAFFRGEVFSRGEIICDADLDKTSGDEDTGLFAGLFLFLPGQQPVVGGRVSDLFFEKGAEGADAFEAHLVADIRDSPFFARQGSPGLFESFAGEILVGC